MAFFFGEHDNVKYTDEKEKYFSFKHYLSENEVILEWEDVIDIKGKQVMIVGKNKGHYLKNWKVLPIRIRDLEKNSYAIKVQRDWFNTYTFKSNFEGYENMKNFEFDDLVEVAKQQDDMENIVSYGWYVEQNKGDMDF